MSLLDDVSIVVTPNGYKAGELYAVVPVPTEGAEEGTNMDFSSGTSPWALNSNWSLGGVGVIADGTSNSTVWQNSVVEDNKQYIVTYTLTDFLQGTVNVELAGSHGISRTIAGTYTEVITSGTSPTTRITFEGSGNFQVTLSNVIVKEYTSADMDVTRATAATRVDENGLVNYAEIIGGEEVTNGDFSGGSTGWTTSGGWSITDKATNSGSGGQIYPVSNSWVSGSTVRFLVTVSNRTTGHIRIQNPAVSVYYQNNINTNDSFIFEFTTVDSAGWKIEAISGFDGTIDNVSVKEVTRDNVPRIDYTGGGCPHILAEPQRTNVFIQNDISTWNGFSSYADETTAPDGTTIDFVNMEDRRIFPTTTISNSTEYTSSIYLKGNKTANVKLRNTAANDTVITLSAEWQRFELTATSSSTLTNALLIDARYGQGMGAAGLEIAIYGGQVEEGSYATSYIPTSGSTVTRNQDIFTRDGIGSLINSTEGVLFVEMAAFSNDGTNRTIALSDGTGNNLVRLYFSNSSNRIVAQVKVGGSTQVTFDITGVTVIDFNKVALKYKENDFSIWINGVERGTDTSGATPTSMNRLALDNGSGSENLFGKVKQLQVYKTALTDVQLAALTS